MAEQLHHQPAGVAAGADGQLQGFFRRLHAGLHADRVLDVALKLLVETDQKVDGALGCAVNRRQVGLEQGRGGFGGEVGRQLNRLGRAVLEGKLLGFRLQEEIKRVEHRHLDHQVHRDLELARRFGEHQPRLVVGKRVLLPVDEMLFGLNRQRIRQHPGAAVRRRSQPNHLWPEIDQPVVFVVGDVAEGDVDGQGNLAFLIFQGTQTLCRRNKAPAGQGPAITVLVLAILARAAPWACCGVNEKTSVRRL